MTPRRTTALALSVLLAACNFPGTPTASPSATLAPSPIPLPPRATASETPALPPTLTPLPPRLPLPDETILILEPGPGSRVTSPVHVAGIADPTFEQHLVIRIVLDDGTQLTLQPTTIGVDVGNRGPFAADVPFSVSGEQRASIQVYATSARDGGITHLASVGATLAAGGAPEIAPAAPHPEQLVIFQPALGETISGGIVHVEGYGRASFEGTLVVEVYDADGNQVGSQSLIVDAPEAGAGQPGPFSVDVPYTVSGEGPGRIVVVEDHRPEGGLGSAVAEALAARGQSLVLAHLAVRGMPGSASPEEQRAAAGIDAAAIAAAVRRLAAGEAGPDAPLQASPAGRGDGL